MGEPQGQESRSGQVSVEEELIARLGTCRKRQSPSSVPMGQDDLEQPQSGRQAGGRNSETRGYLSQGKER